MDVRRTRAVLATAGALALGVTVVAGAAPKDHPGLWQGVTAQGVVVKIVVAESGNTTKFTIGKTDSKCGGGETFTNKRTTYQDLDISDPASFATSA